LLFNAATGPVNYLNTKEFVHVEHSISIKVIKPIVDIELIEIVDISIGFEQKRIAFLPLI
jgi:hypothetical protein